MMNIKDIAINGYYDKPKYIIMMSIDNLRFDCIGYQNNKSGLVKYQLEDVLNTQNLDSIAEKSICFTNAISTSTYTTSSHASIITGLYPPRNGVRAFYDTQLSDNVSTLAELLKDQGYLTILSTDILELWEPLNLHRGFDHIFERQDKELNEFLDLHKSENIFVFIHYLDIHEPYIFSEYEIYQDYNSDYYDIMNELCNEYKIEFDKIKERPHTSWRKFSEKIMRNKKILFPLFIRGVNKFDNGRFKKFIKYLKESGYLNKSLLVIFSDHGEGRCVENEDFFAHAGELYDDVIKVPLIIYNNNLKHKIIDAQISMVDIFPTIIDLSLNKDIFIPYKIDGQSLLPEISGTDKKTRLAYSEVWLPDDTGTCYIRDGDGNVPNVYRSNNIMNWILFQRSIRIKNKKYIIFGKPEIVLDNHIFDLPNDEFIEKLYFYILGRNKDIKGFEYWFKNLNLKIFSKKDVLISFLKSEECQKKRFIIFDLENDPWETNPIDPINSPIDTIEYFTYINNILDLEKLAMCSKKINVDIEDEKKIKKRLKDLGYLD